MRHTGWRDDLKFGLSYNTAYYSDPDLMAAVAQHAEECGFESFFTPEHIVVYPGATAGTMTFPPDLAVADPLDCLASHVPADGWRDGSVCVLWVSVYGGLPPAS